MSKLHESTIHHLHPTQLTVGMREVHDKMKRLQHMQPHEQQEFMRAHLIPAVLGPQQRLYITDHHHLGRAAYEADVKTGFFEVQADLSALDMDAFWAEMEKSAWVHPLDEFGVRHHFSSIPNHLEKLKDDPYRSLAGFVRNAGGYEKTHAAFAEFLWADFFRRHIEAEDLHHKFDSAVERAIALAQSEIASTLPGHKKA